MEKIIHQIWVGKNKVPKREQGFIEQVKEYNPECSHYLWTDETVDREEFPEPFKINYDQFYKEGKFAFCADLLRMWVVYQWGGFYLDVDFEPIQSLNGLLNQSSGIIFHHPNDYPIDYTIVNGAFGFEGGAEELKYCIDNVTPGGHWYGPEWFGRHIKKFLGLEYECPPEKLKEKLDKKNVVLYDWDEFHAKYYRHHALYSWSDRYIAEI